MFFCLHLCRDGDTLKVQQAAARELTMATKTRPPKQKPTRSSPPDTIQRVQVVKVGKEPKLLLRERLNMTRELFGRVVNVSPRAIATVEREQADVAKLERPYAEVARLYEALGEVVDEKAIGPWFVTPNASFGGLKPIEIIERGEIDRLWDMVYRLRSGMPG
jgi:DNA-binding XRE family transcriptional regulator